MTLNNTRILRPFLALGAAAALSACASVSSVDETLAFEASRGTPSGAVLAAPIEEGLPLAAPAYDVVGISVNVPDTLRVSEANRYLPGADIVWREDPIGNRYEQIRKIFEAALTTGTDAIVASEDARKVHLDVSVSRFHALTEKARYTVGGVHAIQFSYRLRDAETGDILMEPKWIKADFDALGGNAAVRAEARGVTQKVRITNHLAYVIEQELTRPEGFTAYDTGLIGALNQL